jgi:hypothetical protein
MGSTRFELDPSERSVFLDLMVLGAKDDGYIRANEEMGYPHEYLSRILNVPIELLDETIAKCLKVGKLEEFPNGIYHITNWDSYRLSDSYKRALTLGIKKVPGSKETESVSSETHTVSRSMSMYRSISFKGRVWEGVTVEDKKAWAEAYPACDIDIELKKAGEWIIANPAKGKKSNYRRFLVAWFSRSQDHGGTAGVRPEYQASQVGKHTDTPDEAYWAEVRRLKALGIEGQALTDAMAEWKKKEGKNG